MEYDPIQSWVDNVAFSHSKNQSTPLRYKKTLRKFLSYIGKSVEEVFKEYDSMEERAFKRQYSQYLKAWISKMSQRDLTSGSINAYVSVIKSFFKYTDLPLAFVPTGRTQVVFHNRDIQREEVQSILAASRPRERAFYTMMAQSGLRPDTLVKLKLKNIEPDFSANRVPCLIRVGENETKGKYGAYWSFMGQESIDALKAYFSTERTNISNEDYIFEMERRRRKRTNAIDRDAKTFSVLFGLTVRQLKANKVLNFEERAKKPSELRLYTLRKYFRRNAGKAGADFVNFWMGHQSKNGVDQHYISVDPEFHRIQYSKYALPELTLRIQTLTPTEQTIEQLQKQVHELELKLQSSQFKADAYKTAATEKPKTEEEIQMATLLGIAMKAYKKSGKSFEEFLKSTAKKVNKDK